MASKGAYEEGTDGSDHSFRQRVKDVYVHVTYFKKRLSVVSKATTVALLMTFAIATTFFKDFPFHYAVVLTAFLPLIADKAAKSNSVPIMTTFSLLSALSAAYIVIIGVGRTMDLMEASGFDLQSGMFVTMNIVVVLFLLVGCYYARRLIGIWRDQAFERQLRSEYKDRKQ